MTDSIETAVVTGGASGIGRAITEELVGDGYRVVVLDLVEPDPFEAPTERIEYREADVTDPDSLQRAFTDLTVDVLVNNAAYYAPLVTDKKRFDEISAEEWDTVLAVNTKGVFLTTKYALPQFEANARVVNIGSSVVVDGVSGFLHYVASKGAVQAMSRAMATELGDLGISVNVVLPGFTDSEASQQAGDEYSETLSQSRAIKRRVQPEDVANVVAFLADPASHMMTGQSVLVNGGQSFI